MVKLDHTLSEEKLTFAVWLYGVFIVTVSYGYIAIVIWGFYMLLKLLVSGLTS